MIGRLIVIAIVLMMAWLDQAHSATLQDRVVANSARYLHVRELHNDNRGPEIDQWLRYLGLPMGSPYCAAFLVWNYYECGYKLPKIGRCSLLWQTVRHNELRYKTFTAEQVALGVETIQPADGVIWRHGNGPGQNWNGHAGIALRQIDRSTFKSREGNTMPTATGNQREGGGVFDRTRKLGFGSSFRVVGFIRVR